MAQHISIMNSEMKGLQKVADNLCAKVSRGIRGISGSLKFEEVTYKEHKINPDDRVFVNERTVNGKREIFELYYDTKTEKVLDIYLVK